MQLLIRDPIVCHTSQIDDWPLGFALHQALSERVIERALFVHRRMLGPGVRFLSRSRSAVRSLFYEWMCGASS